MVKNLIYKWELNSKMYQKGWKVKTECRNLAADNRKGVNVKVKRWTNKVAIGLRADAGHLASVFKGRNASIHHRPLETLQ